MSASPHFSIISEDLGIETIQNEDIAGYKFVAMEVASQILNEPDFSKVEKVNVFPDPGQLEDSGRLFLWPPHPCRNRAPLGEARKLEEAGHTAHDFGRQNGFTDPPGAPLSGTRRTLLPLRQRVGRSQPPHIQGRVRCRSSTTTRVRSTGRLTGDPSIGHNADKEV